MPTSKPVKKTGKHPIKKAVKQDVNKVDKGIDVEKALRLRLKNRLSFREIGELMNVSGQAIEQRLSAFKAYIQDPDVIHAYEQNKAELLSSVEKGLIEKILDPEKLEKANLNNVAYAFTQIHTANRLERNQATAITDDVDAIIQRVESRYRKAIDVTPINNDNQ
jgi:predicted DNA-binding protein YlxM (UPF0122 family)